MNVTQRTDDAAIHLHAAGRTFQYTTGSVVDVAALTDRWLDAKFELLGHRNLDLRVLACRPKDTDTFDLALGADD